MQNEVSMLMLKADPRDETCIYNLHKEAKEKVTKLMRKDIKSLNETYTGNTLQGTLQLFMAVGHITPLWCQNLSLFAVQVHHVLYDDTEITEWAF